MEVAGLANVDWLAPWLAPIARVGRLAAASSDWRGALNSAAAAANVHSSGGHRITFCEAGAAADEAYEAFIARTGCVPTRDDLHDFFSALIFIHFPCAKAQLNRLQADAIARDGVGAVRGSVRDAATLVDENAVLIVTARIDIVDLLCHHDWRASFVAQRAAWSSDVKVIGFGHALLHKLHRPYKAITAHALHIALAADAPLAQVDRSLADRLDEHLSPHGLMPIPVLGIPGWCAENRNAEFYSDRTVFRPAKMRRDCKAETDS